MSYRDELEAARAHATSAEEDLAAARAEISTDEKRIAELEKQLAQAQRRVGQAQDDHSNRRADDSSKGGSGASIILGVLVVSAAVAGALIFGPTGRSRRFGNAPAGNTFDVSSSLSEATALARAKLPDAELVSMRAHYVTEDGLSQLQFNDDVRYRFRSPSLANQPAPQASKLGAPPVDTRKPCRVSVWVSSSSALHAGSASDAGNCGDPPPSGPLRCTVANVWQRALMAGAPKDSLADVSLDPKNRLWHWKLTVTDRNTSRIVFRYDSDDDC